MRDFVTYLRVSTQRQGQSGLGLEAQQKAVQDYAASCGGAVLAEFVEVESGKRNDRPKLAQAMQRCRLTGAVLLIAKLDRLSRDAHFLIGLEKAGVEFVAADMPHANRLTVGIMALVAQQEREPFPNAPRLLWLLQRRVGSSWVGIVAVLHSIRRRAQWQPQKPGGTLHRPLRNRWGQWCWSYRAMACPYGKWLHG